MEYIDNSKTLYDETKAEPQVQFYDNAVTQMDVDAYNISSLEEHELHELSVQILNELQGMMPNTFKKYDKMQIEKNKTANIDDNDGNIDPRMARLSRIEQMMVTAEGPIDMGME